MISPAIPRRKLYEQYKILERYLNELNIVTVSKKSYLKHLSEYKRYHFHLKRSFEYMNALLQIYYFGYPYNTEEEYNKLLKKLRKKHMNILQYPYLSEEFKSNIKNIYYLFKEIKLSPIVSNKIYSKIIKTFKLDKFSNFLFFDKKYLKLKELYKELIKYENHIISIIEKRDKNIKRKNKN